MRWGALALLASCVVAAIVLAWAAAALPPEPATHFDLSGRPDASMPKESFLLVMGLLIAGVAALFAGLGWMIPRLPDAFVNLPHKRHWLAPERRDETMRTFVVHVQWMGAASVLLFTFLVWSTARANAPEIPTRVSPRTEIALAVWLAVIGAMVVHLVWRFRRP